LLKSYLSTDAMDRPVWQVVVTTGWTNNPATWPGVINWNVRGYLILIGPPTITAEFGRNESDRTVLVSLQDYCQLLQQYIIHVSASS